VSAHDERDSGYEQCLACGYAPLRVLRCIRAYTIVQCPRCLLARTLNARIEPATFYDDAYFISADAPKGYSDYLTLALAMERTNRARLRRLQRLKPGARTLLDAGCGPAFFVKAAFEAGLDACGLEVSEFAAGYGRERLNQHIVTGPIDAAHLSEVGGPFDLITLWDVIEHLPAPGEALQSLAERLTPGGVLTLSTGDIGSLVARASGAHWHLYNLPEHLWFFSVPSLKRMLRRAGLHVIGVQREICWYTAQYLLERLVYSLGRRPARFPVAPILRRINVPVTLLDIVTISARKPE
jgi:SAM-dependent methyltransferase